MVWALSGGPFSRPERVIRPRKSFERAFSSVPKAFVRLFAAKIREKPDAQKEPKPLR
jgi:hypothetical protein